MRLKNLKVSCALLVVSILFTACATSKPHNDVMIFGTSTNIGVEVGAPVQNAGIPAFKIGYNRHEAVWMPLKPNHSAIEGDDAVIRATNASKALNACDTTLRTSILDTSRRQSICLDFVLPTNKYVSSSAGISPDKGGVIREVDTYSVFASFGGSGNLSLNNASGNLAQFFATGVAAQRLGANPAIGLALNARSDAAVAEISKADAALVKVREDAARELEGNKVKAAALKPCLTTSAKAATFQADSDLGPYSTGLPNATAADNLITVLETDSVSLTKAETLCK